MDTDTVLSVVSAAIGRRHTIARREMRRILEALVEQGLNPTNDCTSDPSPAAWADRCRGIECISILAGGTTPHGEVRFDQPGSMAPLHQAAVLFAPASLAERDPGSIPYLRQHARRVLIVRDDPPAAQPPAPEPAAAPDWVRRLRREPWCDGTWIRVHPDGVLELRDPNSGQRSDPDRTARDQYRIGPDGDVERRRLPPVSVGDAWADIGVPEWEAISPPRTGPVWDWIEAQM